MTEERTPISFDNEGQKIFGVIHRPLSPGKHPGILFCHGLAGHKTGKYRFYVQLAQQLTQLGFTVLRFDFRGSGDSEGEFEEVTVDTQLSDAKKALQVLQQDPSVDPDVIGLFGRSFGGLIVTRLAQGNRSIKSIAMWAPVFSGYQWKDKWEEFKNTNVPPEMARELMKINGQCAGRKFYEQLFCVDLEQEFLSLSDVHFFVVHSENDEIVSIDHAKKYLKLRERSEAMTEMLQLSKSDHEFSDEKERRHALEETVRWFKTTLEDKR